MATEWANLLPETGIDSNIEQIDFANLIPEQDPFAESAVSNNDFASLLTEDDIQTASPRPVSPAIRPPVGKDVKPGVREAPMPQMEAVLPEQELIDQASQEQRLLDTIPEDDESVIGKILKTFKRGRQELQADIDVGRAVAGVNENLPDLVGDPIGILKSIGDRTLDESDLERLKPLVARQIAQEGLDPIEGSNKIATGIYEASRMMGGMYETIAKSWDDALAGMAFGAKAGSPALAAGAVPGALGISVGAAGGFLTGSTIGTAKEWYFQGAGQIYRDMIADGLDKDTSKNVALVGAVPYAAAEFVASRFLGGLVTPKQLFIGKLTKKTFMNGIRKIGMHTVKEHLKQTGGEIFEEGVQEIITDTSKRIGTYIHNQKWKDTKEAINTRQTIENSMDTMIRSALPIALTMAPSASFQFSRNAMRLQEQKSLITDADKQQANLSEQFGQENVTRVNPTTLAVTTPQGTMRMQFEDDLTKSALENPEGFLDSIRAQSKRGAEAVSKAMKRADNDVADAADILMENDEYAPKGKTVANAEITDEQGNTVTVDQLISLETGFATGGTAQHEIWHALKGLMQITPAEQAELDNRLGIDPALVSEAKREEIEAYALENYSDRMNVGAFGRVLDFIDKFLGGYKEVNEPLGQAVERVRDAMLQRKQTEGLNTEAEKYPTLTDEEKAGIDAQMQRILNPQLQIPESTSPDIRQLRGIDTQGFLGVIAEERRIPQRTETRQAEIDAEQKEIAKRRKPTIEDDRPKFASPNSPAALDYLVRVLDARPSDVAGMTTEERQLLLDDPAFLQAKSTELAIKRQSEQAVETVTEPAQAGETVMEEAIAPTTEEIAPVEEAIAPPKQTVKQKPAKKLTRPELRAKATELGVSDKGGNQALRKRIETAEKPKAEKKVEAKAKPEAKAKVEDDLVGKEVRIGSRTLKVLKALPQSEVEKEAGEQFYQLKDTKTGEVIEEERESLNTKAKTLSEMTRKEIFAEAKRLGIQIQKGDSKSFVANLIRQKAKREKAGTKFSVSQPPLKASEIRENNTQNNTQAFGEDKDTGKTLEEQNAEEGETPITNFKEMNTYNRVTKLFANWFSFGELFFGNTKAYEQFIRTKHALSSAADLSIAETNALIKELAKESGVKFSKFTGGKIVQEGDHVILFALEEKGGREKLDARQQKIYDMIENSIKADEKAQKEAGVFKFGLSEKGVEEAINYINTEIQSRTSKKDIDSKTKDEIRSLQKSLATMTEFQENFAGYVSHVPIVRKFMELKGKQRADFAKRLELFVHQRKGKHSLRDFTEGFKDSNGKFREAILSPADLNPIQMMAEMKGDAYKRIATTTLVNEMKVAGYIQQKQIAKNGFVVKDVPQGWLDASQIKGISQRGLKDMFIHPLVAGALSELSESNSVKKNGFRKLLAITKVGQFFVPGIVITYDIMQGIQRGMWSANPIKQAKYIARAFSSVINQDTDWQEAHKFGLGQKPSIPTIAAEAELYDKLGQEVDATVKTRWKFGSKAVDQKLTPSNAKEAITAFIKNPIDAMMLPYRAIGKVTWMGDDVIRMISYHAMKDLYGDQMTAERRADYAAKAHGAYALPSKQFKDVASLIFFVHTFRLLMPWEHIKTHVTIPKMIYNKVIGGKQINKAEAELAVKALTGTILTPLTVFMMMTANGWEPDDEGLPEWWKTLKKGTMQHWKFKKTVRGQDGKKREIVTGINTIINMPTKWIERFIKEKPEKLNDVSYHIANAFKWEINPMYRNFLDVATNTSSMGGTTPYQVGDKTSKQVYDAAKYFFDNTFRLYGEMSRPEMSGAYQRQVKSDLEGALNGFEKVMLGYFTGYKGLAGKFAPLQVGYTYSRKDRRARYGSARQALARAISAEIGNISSTYADRPEIRRKKTRELKKLQREREKRLRDIFLGDKT